jgi:CubicO group peptidase (beta-lactamase class C family)
MNDTFFVIPDDRRSRLAKIYRRTEQGLAAMENFGWLESKTYFSGAGGLSSTAADYFRFAQMLLNGGELNGHRILSPRSVELMSTNQVGEMFVGQLGRPKGMGFGFTVEVVVDHVAAETGRSNGSYGWDGAFGTHFWVDPKEQLVAVLMVQTPSTVMRSDYENAVIHAVVK